MSRKRSIHIHESLEHLRTLEENYRGQPQEARIRVLRLLKESPERSLDQIASIAGCDVRTVSRWSKLYMESGLQSMSNRAQGSAQHTNRLGGEGIEELRMQLQKGVFSTLGEVQAWIEARFGLHYSLPGILYLLQSRLKARQVWMVPPDGDGVAERIVHTPAVEGKIFPDKVLNFLNQMPVINNTDAWVEQFRDALKELLGGVDRVSLYIDTACDLVSPGSYKPDMYMILDVAESLRSEGGVSVVSQDNEKRPSELLLEKFRYQGMPLHDYQDPVCFDYYFAGQAYLGSLFLWRDRSKVPISRQIRETVTLLEPFIIFTLSDLIARYHYANPVDKLFLDALQTMTLDADLNTQERRVVMLRLLGSSYKEIADEINITVGAIKKILGSVHRKTETRSYTELFAKYFTPRIHTRNTR